MINWPEHLIEAIALRKSVLFLGAGISANASNEAGKHPASWKQFLSDILETDKGKIGKSAKIIKKCLNENDYLTACEIIVDIIGDLKFGERVDEEFRKPGYKPCDIHRLLYRLDSRIVITPNVDKIYEQYAISESNSTVVAKSYYDQEIVASLRKNDFLIIRAHGSSDDSSRIIFTRKQYGEARCLYASFYKILESLAITHTFVFLGCGISDPDIQLVLENQNLLYPNSRPHYFVTAHNTFKPEIENVLKNNRNIELLTYSNKDKTHQKLQESLEVLAQKVEIRRKEIADKQTW